MQADSKKVLRQLKIIRGQVDGIIKMVEDDRYCIDISNQILAARAALNKTNSIIMAAHLESCVVDSANSEDEENKKEKLEELSKLIQKLLS